VGIEVNIFVPSFSEWRGGFALFLYSKALEAFTVD